ncbi:MAG: hypothetical protein EB038_06025 [Cyclobacteriaceae bacterium]|nr:hypothetical protein [Cyclobacteriaceae bacterium]
MSSKAILVIRIALIFFQYTISEDFEHHDFATGLFLMVYPIFYQSNKNDSSSKKWTCCCLGLQQIPTLCGLLFENFSMTFTCMLD